MVLDYIKLFLEEQRFRGNSSNTVDDYRYKLFDFYRFSSSNKIYYLRDVNLPHLRAYHQSFFERGVDNTITVQSYIRSLRAFLKWAYYEGYIHDDLCSRFKLPKAKKNYIDVLTDDEIRLIYQCYPDGSNSIHLRNRVIISLMLDCGLRLDEVVNVKYSQVYIKECYLIVTGKGNKQRAVSFGGSTKQHLINYLSCVNPLLVSLIKSDSLFLTSEAYPITQNTIKNLFRKLKLKSGIQRLHPHLLRHTFATRYLENGGDIYVLKNLLGHTTLTQTMHYLHIAETRIQKDFYRFSPLDNLQNKKPSKK